MEHNKGKYTEGTYACSFHEILSTKISGNKSDSIQTVTAYVDAAYGEYVMKSGKTESVGGCSMPLALTFRLENEGYTLVEYWEPESGRHYADSIRDKFPSSVAESVIKNPYHAAEQCQAKAEAYFNENASSASGNYHYLGRTKAYTTSDEVEVYVGEIDLGAKNPYITLVWNNNSDKELYTGSMFTLYRFENNEWKLCKSKDDLSWSLEQKILLAGKSKEESYNLSVKDISENGYYRLTKDFKLGYEGHTATAEFVIDINEGWEKLELPVGESMLVPDSLYTVYRDEVSSKQSDSWSRFKHYSNNGLIEYIETVEPLTGCLIKSKAELEDFIVTMTPYFNLSSLEKGTTFLDRTKEFDNEFFKENSLMIMYVNESSCSITHSLSDIYRFHQKAPEESRRESEGHVLSFEVQRNIPEICADGIGEWFITVAMDNAAIGDVHGFYVTYGENMIENSKVYRFDGNDTYAYAYIRLYDDKRMEFMFSPLSSYLPYGTYTLDKEKLVMKTDDGKNTYTFKVDGENFVFDAANSSAMPEYYASKGKTYVAVPDGAIFIP
ncbi:MAG: hypothetical protein IJE74_02965 [Clostridia bacterium]|nr:hypothetical protein [Clostridia bacterium]